MSALRVYHVAQQAQQPSKAVMQVMRDLGLDVLSPSSRVEPVLAQTLLAQMGNFR